MSHVRSTDTKPERILRAELHRRGLRYRLHRRMLGKPDLAFVTPRVAVFVDGDYWHGNAWRTRGYPDFESYYGRGKNGSFWISKIRRNIERDLEVAQGLRAGGWCVIRVWETDLIANLGAAAERIEMVVRERSR